MPRSAGGRSLTSSPSNISLPEVMSSRPATRRSSVDLPQPDGPTNTTNSLFLMSRSTPLITSTGPNDLLTCRIVMSAIAASHMPLLGRDRPEERAVAGQRDDTTFVGLEAMPGGRLERHWGVEPRRRGAEIEHAQQLLARVRPQQREQRRRRVEE